LGQILGLFWRVTPAPCICIKRIPVDSVELTKRRLGIRRLALSREQHHAPPSRTESVRVVSERSFLRLQGSPQEEVIRFNPNLKPNFRLKREPRTCTIMPLFQRSVLTRQMPKFMNPYADDSSMLDFGPNYQLISSNPALAAEANIIPSDSAICAAGSELTKRLFDSYRRAHCSWQRQPLLLSGPSHQRQANEEKWKSAQRIFAR